MISIGKSPKTLREELGGRTKKQRLIHNLSRESLSEKSGVPVPTIRKFENTGEISLKSFIALLQSLDRIDEIENLMLIKEPQNLSELKNRKRQRGHK